MSAHIHIALCVSPEAGRPDAALHPRGEHVQPLVCAVGPGRGHALQRPGEDNVDSHLPLATHRQDYFTAPNERQIKTTELES